MVLQLVFTPNLTNYHTLVFGLHCHSQTEVQYLAQNEIGKEVAVWQVIFSVKYQEILPLKSSLPSKKSPANPQVNYMHTFFLITKLLTVSKARFSYNIPFLV